MSQIYKFNVGRLLPTQQYRFKLLNRRDQEMNVPDFTRRNTKGQLLVTIRHGCVCTVYPAYSWDGCTPKWSVGRRIVGVWDGPMEEQGYKQKDEYGNPRWDTIYFKAQQLAISSLRHDVLRQFLPPGMAVVEMDWDFYRHMQKVGWPLAKLYYRAVRFYVNHYLE